MWFAYYNIRLFNTHLIERKKESSNQFFVILSLWFLKLLENDLGLFETYKIQYLHSLVTACNFQPRWLEISVLVLYEYRYKCKIRVTLLQTRMYNSFIARVDSTRFYFFVTSIATRLIVRYQSISVNCGRIAGRYVIKGVRSGLWPAEKIF